METKNVQDKANYVLIFLSSFGIGYSVVKYFLLTQKGIDWTSILPLFIISVIILPKSIKLFRK